MYIYPTGYDKVTHQLVSQHMKYQYKDSLKLNQSTT